MFVRKGSRLKPQEECGDVIRLSGDGRAMVLCDGISSCACGARSAREGTERIIAMYETAKEYLWRMIADGAEADVAAMMLRELSAYFSGCARAEGRRLSDFGSTVAFAMHDPRRGKIFAFTLGDSIIRVRFPDGYDADLCGGGRGHVLDCSTTDPKAENSAVVRVLDDTNAESLLFLSDGAWRALPGRGRMMTMGEIVVMLRHYKPQDDAAAGVLKIRRKGDEQDA